MVQLSLTTVKGNGGSRHFPFHGYLGLTPIRVEGIVRTRLDEDLKPIQAKSLTVSVRAYESRPSRIGSPHTRLLVDYSQTLWRKPDGQSYADLGEFDATFKITLPKRVAGFSSANYQDYRTFWRVEAGACLVCTMSLLACADRNPLCHLLSPVRSSVTSQSANPLWSCDRPTSAPLAWPSRIASLCAR